MAQLPFPGFHRSGPPGPHPGSRFSQYLFSDLRLGGLPSRKMSFGVGDSLVSFIEDVFVPGRRLNGFWTTGEVIPKQLHSRKLFVEGHLF
jgi:hypothetical protein